MSSSTLNSWTDGAQKPHPTARTSPQEPTPPTHPRPHLGSDHAPLELAERLAVVGFPSWPQPHSPLLRGALPALLHLQLGERVQGVLWEADWSVGHPPGPTLSKPTTQFSDPRVVRCLSFPQAVDQEILGNLGSLQGQRSLGLSGDP